MQCPCLDRRTPLKKKASLWQKDMQKSQKIVPYFWESISRGRKKRERGKIAKWPLQNQSVVHPVEKTTEKGGLQNRKRSKTFKFRIASDGRGKAERQSGSGMHQKPHPCSYKKRPDRERCALKKWWRGDNTCKAKGKNTFTPEYGTKKRRKKRAVKPNHSGEHRKGLAPEKTHEWFVLVGERNSIGNIHYHDE